MPVAPWQPVQFLSSSCGRRRGSRRWPDRPGIVAGAAREPARLVHPVVALGGRGDGRGVALRAVPQILGEPGIEGIDVGERVTRPCDRCSPMWIRWTKAGMSPTLMPWILRVSPVARGGECGLWIAKLQLVGVAHHAEIDVYAVATMPQESLVWQVLQDAMSTMRRSWGCLAATGWPVEGKKS